MSFKDLFDYIQSLMIDKQSIFQDSGNNVYRSLVVIMFCWFCISALMHNNFTSGNLFELVKAIGLGALILFYYSNPMPVLGISFSQLILDWGKGLANQLNDGMVTKIIERLLEVYRNLETPGIKAALFNTIEVVRWAVTVALLLGCAATVYVVICFGYVASAILVLLGPVLIPFCIVPKFEQLFWNWLFALIQYTFYPVVANAFLYVVGNMLINFVDRAGTDFSASGIAVLFLPLVVFLISFVFMTLKIPSLTNSMFTGRSGESTLVPRWSY